MKKLTALLLFLFAFALVKAQFKQIAEGPVFEEPESGYAKVIQLKNGTTFFFHITNKEGIDLKIYDANHKQKVVKHLEPAYGKLKYGSIEGIFEISGNVVLMISEVDAKVPVLYRLVVDGKTGALKEEKQIAELKKLNMGQGYAVYFGNVPLPDFFVRKDPNSDYYALAMFNSFESDRSKRIEVVFYGPDNKEVSRAYYSSPNNKYKYLKYIDMTVIGKEKVSILAYAYNTAASGGKESELVLANLDEGSTTVTLDELDFSKDLIVDGGITRYNPVTKKIVLLAIAKTNEKKSRYQALLANVDPFARKLEKVMTAYPAEANEKSLEIFGKKGAYTGMPQNLFINNDGSFSVVYEEIAVTTSYSSSGASSSYTELGNVAIALYDKEGKEIKNYLVPKNHKLLTVAMSPLYHSVREGTAQRLDIGNQFKSFAYLSGTEKSYVLFNDIERNAESLAEKGKLTTITGVGECDGFYYPIVGSDVIPKRDFVFGKAESKKEHNLALFAISDYNKETNVYVTLKLEKEGRDKGVKIVWLQPQ